MKKKLLVAVLFLALGSMVMADQPLPPEPQGPGPDVIVLGVALLQAAYAWWMKVL